MTEQPTRPMIFLAGPPGAGKTALGSAVCEELGLRFLDLAAETGASADAQAQKQTLKRGIAERAADVVELPWELQQEKDAMKTCRLSGKLIALWAHPLQMQERSGRSEPLFTPSKAGLKTGGGFGRRGTSCREFRSLDRACETTLLLGGLSLEDARGELREAIAELIEPPRGSLAEQEKIDDWVDYWKSNFDADPQAAEVLIEAMARFIRHLREQGKSPRSLRGIYRDLEALGQLNFGYGQPRGKKVLDAIHSWDYEFSRKYASSENDTRCYLRTYEQFCKFLGRWEDEDE